VQDMTIKLVQITPGRGAIAFNGKYRNTHVPETFFRHFGRPVNYDAWESK
jgi:hypothetical protein